VFPPQCLEQGLTRMRSGVAVKLPPWWKPIVHDRLLVRGIARYGLACGDHVVADNMDEFVPILEKVWGAVPFFVLLLINRSVTRPFC
jgi:hypothetical protein